MIRQTAIALTLSCFAACSTVKPTTIDDGESPSKVKSAYIVERGNSTVAAPIALEASHRRCSSR